MESCFGLDVADVTTVHAATGSQSIVDTPHDDMRRARSVFGAIIPTTTSATRGIPAVLPGLANRVTCMAMRVPAPAVSSLQINIQTRKPISNLEQVMQSFEKAAATEWGARLGVSSVPLVSVDF